MAKKELISKDRLLEILDKYCEPYEFFTAEEMPPVFHIKKALNSLIGSPDEWDYGANWLDAIIHTWIWTDIRNVLMGEYGGPSFNTIYKWMVEGNFRFNQNKVEPGIRDHFGKDADRISNQISYFYMLGSCVRIARMINYELNHPIVKFYDMGIVLVRHKGTFKVFGREGMYLGEFEDDFRISNNHLQPKEGS